MTAKLAPMNGVDRDALFATIDAVKGDMGEGAWELIGLMKPIGAALFQLMHSGSEAQVREALEPGRGDGEHRAGNREEVRVGI